MTMQILLKKNKDDVIPQKVISCKEIYIDTDCKIWVDNVQRGCIPKDNNYNVIIFDWDSFYHMNIKETNDSSI